jgi:hypothetical protein
MYAAHFAAGLAIKSRVPQTPGWAVLAAAFLPDFAWIGLAGAGVEPAGPKIFFDDWSHSLLSIVVLASVFALAFIRKGRPVVIALWLAGLSHFVLDFLIHPKPLALYPHSAIHLGWPLWDWGQAPFWLGFSHYWWVQFAFVVPLLAIYALSERRLPRNLIAASCIAVFGLELVF